VCRRIESLGYRQVNLDGVSYGTRLALTVMRLFPADIRSVPLDLTPAGQRLHRLTGCPQRAFNTLFRGCAANLYCNQHYPHLQAVFSCLVSDLNQHPVPVQVTDPQSGKLMSGLTGDDLVSGLRSALYQTTLIPKLPRLIYQIAHHDYS
jgi:pimeloyl-ACP methyl ester carboxylesterase